MKINKGQGVLISKEMFCLAWKLISDDFELTDGEKAMLKALWWEKGTDMVQRIDYRKERGYSQR
jgi:hypothetical protein